MPKSVLLSLVFLIRHIALKEIFLLLVLAELMLNINVSLAIRHTVVRLRRRN